MTTVFGIASFLWMLNTVELASLKPSMDSEAMSIGEPPPIGFSGSYQKPTKCTTSDFSTR